MPRFSRTQRVVLLQDSIFLAQRIALPFLGHQDAPHVGVPGELYAEHVEYFAFQPVGGQMHGYRGGGRVAVRDHGLHTDPLVAREAI